MLGNLGRLPCWRMEGGLFYFIAYSTRDNGKHKGLCDLGRRETFKFFVKVVRGIAETNCKAVCFYF